MKELSRRGFLTKAGILVGSGAAFPFLPNWLKKRLSPISDVNAAVVSRIFVSKNGTPVTNMQRVIDMAGGITHFIDADDVVVIKPNLQWKNQGYTHTEATKALIEVILNRPGGFSGEVIVAENTHADEDDTKRGWAASPDNRVNNWPDMNYNELISWFNGNGFPNVTAAKMDKGNYPTVSGPSEGHGYVDVDYTISQSGGANGRVCRLSYPIIESSYSGKLIDTKNGVWSGGAYNSQNVKLIFLPTLNNHGGAGSEDYAGATSAVKCHLGFVRSNSWNTGNGTMGIHAVGYNDSPIYPDAVGEAVGEFVSNVIRPTLYITVAEWSGWGGRTSTTGAEQTKTVGLCNDPVALDYWMGKYILGPADGGSQASFLDPSNECNFRKTLQGCNGKGVGTLNEGEMLVDIYDYDNPPANNPPSPPGNVNVT
ncbi:MAG: DUF362 domain-containing protein [gamma proteobacterium endosymbiont of Lamellibrachia anaximandri]|nr:DUF362 domain-containing protein [gamma proteobacterium endosymbiont of Lamellibrachia anaximandri]